MPKIPKYIYVCGPYSANKEDTIEENIEYANDIGIRLAKKGYIPFIPHTMMRNWEDIGKESKNYKVKREVISTICHNWLYKCDSMLFFSQSSGADQERVQAEQLNIKIYNKIEDIPLATNESSQELSNEAVNAYLIEYQQCFESYRHTYSTIWQSCEIFTAISAALFTFSNAPITTKISPLPIIFWYLGIFIPMNRYGEIRRDRLAAIEIELSAAIPGLEMSHSIEYKNARKGIFRVNKFVHALGISMMFIMFFLILGDRSPDLIKALYLSLNQSAVLISLNLVNA